MRDTGDSGDSVSLVCGIFFVNLNFGIRETLPSLTSDTGNNHSKSRSKLIFAATKGYIGIYTLHMPRQVLYKLALR